MWVYLYSVLMLVKSCVLLYIPKKLFLYTADFHGILRASHPTPCPFFALDSGQGITLQLVSRVPCVYW